MSKKEPKARTFIERYLAGEACPEEIDDYVDAWHSTPQGLELHELLGMSKEAYGRWLRNPDVLDEITHAENQAIGPLLIRRDRLNRLTDRTSHRLEWVRQLGEVESIAISSMPLGERPRLPCQHRLLQSGYGSRGRAVC